MQQDSALITFILDESGSMGHIAQAARDGFNEYLEEQVSHGGATWWTLTTFNTHTHTRFAAIPGAEVRPLGDDYSPGGMTALYDAVGRSITKTRRHLKKLGKDRPPDVIVVISEHGLKRIRPRLEAAPASCTIYSDAGIPLPDTAAVVRPLELTRLKERGPGLSPAVAALGAAGRLVGEGPDRGELVGSQLDRRREQLARVVGRHQPERRVGAPVHLVVRPHRQDRPISSGADLETALQRAQAAAEQGRDNTIPMLAKKGRASYLGERSIGHLDPGAASTALLFAAAASALS